MAVDMRRCSKCGSFYNAAKDSTCPFCSDNGEDKLGKTTPVYMEPVPVTSKEPTTLGKTEAAVSDINAIEEIADLAIDTPIIEEVMTEADIAEKDYGRTVAVITKQMGIDPVVGWLVCKSGEEKGKDYRIHAENNYIGRGEAMDICIRGDETITRDNHAIITYDNIKGEYFFTPGMGRSIIRINENVVLAPTKLNAYDEIEMGTTKFVFVPLCGPHFMW